MEQRRQVTLLGDSILKGIQVDLDSRRYRSQNEINVGALESEFQLSIHNDAHFGATVRKGSRLLDRMLERGMAVSLGRLREDTQYDYKFVGLSHNTLRGAAGGAVLLAELLCANGYIQQV